MRLLFVLLLGRAHVVGGPVLGVVARSFVHRLVRRGRIRGGVAVAGVLDQVLLGLLEALGLATPTLSYGLLGRIGFLVRSATPDSGRLSGRCVGLLVDELLVGSGL